jgi:DNA end-binding protein Ku
MTPSHEPPTSSPEAAPRGRPSWSGLLRLSLVALPVKAYAVVRSAAPSRFHFLHAGCGQRVQYHKHCPSHGPVAADAIVRGYEHAPDRFVVVEPEELDRLRPAADKALVLDRFVAVASIDPSFYAGRSLALLPDGPAAGHPYAVLVAALHEAGQGGLAQVVWSGQRHLVLVRPCGRVLVLDELHYPARVRAVAEWEASMAASAATTAERELAGQLLALAGGPLDWSRYQDTSAADLATLIAAKVAEQPPPADAEPAVVLPLLEALKKSVAAAKGRATNPTPRRPRQRRQTA